MQIYVPISQIDDNPYQARQEYGDVPELAGRIAAALDSYPDSYGLMQIPRGRLVVADVGTIVTNEDITLSVIVDFCPPTCWVAMSSKSRAKTFPAMRCCRAGAMKRNR